MFLAPVRVSVRITSMAAIHLPLFPRLLSLVPLLFVATASGQVADGTIRSYFTTPVSTPSIIAAEIDSSGRMVAASSSAASGVFRHNADGSKDTTFSNNTYNGSLTSMLIQSDGRILVGGLFTLVNGAQRTYIVRLNTDGTLDTAYPTNFSGTGIQVLASGSGGKFYAGMVNGYGLRRYNSEGFLDLLFYAQNIGTGQVNGKVHAVKELPDGKVMVSHQIANPSSGVVTAYKLERLTSTGEVDPSFSVPTLNAPVEGFEVMPDGRVAIIGEFTSVGGVARTRLAVLQADGSLDTSFNPGAGMDFFSTNPRFGVRFIDNKLYFHGDITIINGASQAGLARYNLDGSVDTSFAIGSGASKVYSLFRVPSGDLFVAGAFSTINSKAAVRAAFLALGDSGGNTDAFAAYLDAAQVPAGKRGPQDDADDDGIPNLMEYALGLRVMVPDPAGLPVATQGGVLSLTYRHAHDDVTYAVETSRLGTDGWTTAGVNQGVPGPDGTTTATVALDGTGQFLRLKVAR